MTNGLPPPLAADEAAAIVDAMCPMLGITIDPDWQPAIVQNLQGFSAAGRLVLAFPLPDELEPAPVFGA